MLLMLLPTYQKVMFLGRFTRQSSHVRRDPAAGSASNEDTTAAAVTADKEEKTKLLSDSKEDSDEAKSTESDKDK